MSKKYNFAVVNRIRSKRINTIQDWLREAYARAVAALESIGAVRQKCKTVIGINVSPVFASDYKKNIFNVFIVRRLHE